MLEDSGNKKASKVGPNLKMKDSLLGLDEEGKERLKFILGRNERPNKQKKVGSGTKSSRLKKLVRKGVVVAA
ncbi:conserved hypothetical protein [Ricinus communis]|uniref:Uncharacterized protein n=1 Tax=Ricinus communis TaxID=3988 RepID=B9T380_RICCO|nr:conserved hypothetical protein [Ricinus communis]